LADLTDESLQAARDFLEDVQPDTPQNEGNAKDGPECDCDGVPSCSHNKETTNEAIEQMLTVNLRLDTLLSPDIVSALNNAISGCTETTQILLRFQFQEPPDSWAKLLESFCNHWQEMRDKKRLIVTLSGVFDEISDEDCAFFAENDIQLEYVHQIADAVPHFSEESKAMISQIAGSGLRLPIVWYIDESALKHILPLVDEAMFLNFNSGFSVPLSRYSLFAGEFREPDEESYLSFLADLYEQHIFYDDVLFPLNFILINTLKMDKVDFWKTMVFDSETGAFSPVSTSELDTDVFDFFSRLFLWQRWESVCACSREESGTEISERIEE
jgi:hypothetical protein